MRANSQVLIYIDVPKAMASGLKFELSANGVVLTTGDEKGFITPEFFERVEFTGASGGGADRGRGGAGEGEATRGKGRGSRGRGRGEGKGPGRKEGSGVTNVGEGTNQKADAS